MNAVENDRSVTTRAIKLTPETRELILVRYADHFDMPPTDHFLASALKHKDETYYFVTDYVTPTGEVVSWALIPEFIFKRRYRFATKESTRQLISVIEK